MVKKVVSVFIALTITLILVIGISACNPTEKPDGQNQDNNIQVDEPNDSANVSDQEEIISLVSISQVAAEKLRGMISDGDYSEEVFLRVTPVRGAG